MGCFLCEFKPYSALKAFPKAFAALPHVFIYDMMDTSRHGPIGSLEHYVTCLYLPQGFFAQEGVSLILSGSVGYDVLVCHVHSSFMLLFLDFRQGCYCLLILRMTVRLAAESQNCATRATRVSPLLLNRY
jgi:hypothetical protein